MFGHTIKQTYKSLGVFTKSLIIGRLYRSEIIEIFLFPKKICPGVNFPKLGMSAVWRIPV